MKRILLSHLLALAASSAVQADEFGDVLASFGNLSTVAGIATIDDVGVNGWNTSMEAGSATDAELSRPHMAMFDRLGNLYIADKDAHAIRLVTPDNTIVTIAGTNIAGFDGDGSAIEHRLNQPNGLFTFPDGVHYILDLANSRIRRLDTDGQLSTIVTDPRGISIGRGLWVSADESEIYYAAGTEIRRWTAAEGITVHAAGFSSLGNLTVDPFDGTVVATDRVGHAVYKVFADGSKLRIAGNGQTSGGGDGMEALSTGLNEVRGVFYETNGGFYLATHRDSDIWYVDTTGTIHLLVEGHRSNGTHGGDGQPLSTPGLKISEPRAVVLAPNRDLVITENDGGYIRVADRALNVAGDFDYDGELTLTDIDLLTTVVRVGAHPQTFNLDIDTSRLVNHEDRRIWIDQLAGTHYGDANLDGFVDQLDFEIWNAHRFAGGTTWATGDFDGDGLTDVSDFNLWNANRTVNSGLVANVPEPASLLLSLIAVSFFVVATRRAAT